METENLTEVEKQIVELLGQYNLIEYIGIPVATPLCKSDFKTSSISHFFCIEDARCGDSISHNLERVVIDMCRAISLEAKKNGLERIVSADAKWTNVYNKEINPNKSLGIVTINAVFNEIETKS
jgi:hypothetical protein